MPRFLCSGQVRCILVADAYFRILDQSADSARFSAASETGGPWDVNLQHGGPPNALAVREAERLARGVNANLVASRIAADFVGPVPVGEVTATARLVRAARSASLVEVALSAGGRDCLHARVWLVAARDTSDLAPATAGLTPPATEPPAFGLSFPYADSIEWHEVSGSAATPGPAAVWARARLPLIAGEEPSGLQRVALVGDSASGVSAELDWAQWSFLNVDLDIHLARPFEGEWVHLDAATQLGDRGVGLARSTVSDVRGPVGCTAQTLIVAPRVR
ncbi:MAG TPA: thioesterase family protein [Jatrophihabitantaceae bacterium]|nr:thioesterase family protein [Jatrophihabitantaceae bacterium]